MKEHLLPIRLLNKDSDGVIFGGLIMTIEPENKRVFVFVDGQNLFYQAKEAFGYQYPNYDISKLAQAVCAQKGWQINRIFFYTGIPDPGDSPFWNSFWTAKLAKLGRSANVSIYTRSLRYRNQTITLSNGTSQTVLVGQEKGIDVRIALDIIRYVLKNECDVALVFSQDQDLSEVADEIRMIANEQKRWIKMLSAFPTSPAARNTRGINKTDWIKIDRATYDNTVGFFLMIIGLQSQNTMLLNLHIKNYVLIDELNLEFGRGLNIFTGETGAGKSIIIESVGLVLGDRAGAGIVRKGAERCLISAEFDVSGYKELNKFLDDASLAGEDGGTIIIRREVDSGGKSRAFVNDQPVNVSTLASIGDFLVDVHGQHEHQTLLKSAVQRELVDRFAGNEKLLKDAAEKFKSWSALATQKDAQRISEVERERLVDLYSFQLKEINSLKPIPGEEEELEQKLPMLKNAEKLQALSSEAYDLLYGQESSALERTGKALKAVESINALSSTLNGPAETLKNAAAFIDDALREIDRFRGALIPTRKRSTIF